MARDHEAADGWIVEQVHDRQLERRRPCHRCRWSSRTSTCPAGIVHAVRPTWPERALRPATGGPEDGPVRPVVALRPLRGPDRAVGSTRPTRPRPRPQLRPAWSRGRVVHQRPEPRHLVARHLPPSSLGEVARRQDDRPVGPAVQRGSDQLDQTPAGSPCADVARAASRPPCPARWPGTPGRDRDPQGGSSSRPGDLPTQSSSGQPNSPLSRGICPGQTPLPVDQQHGIGQTRAQRGAASRRSRRPPGRVPVDDVVWGHEDLSDQLLLMKPSPTSA